MNNASSSCFALEWKNLLMKDYNINVFVASHSEVSQNKSNNSFKLWYLDSFPSSLPLFPPCLALFSSYRSRTGLRSWRSSLKSIDTTSGCWRRYWGCWTMTLCRWKPSGRSRFVHVCRKKDSGSEVFRVSVIYFFSFTTFLNTSQNSGSVYCALQLSVLLQLQFFYICIFIFPIKQTEW